MLRTPTSSQSRGSGVLSGVNFTIGGSRLVMVVGRFTLVTDAICFWAMVGDRYLTDVAKVT
ncbi:MAG: hypothetical protein F6K41_20415 [Symploca sp. SIO3E6]|nr:hypothetical protein [Caldora sp. SIO3E6]